MVELNQILIWWNILNIIIIGCILCLFTCNRNKEKIENKFIWNLHLFDILVVIVGNFHSHTVFSMLNSFINILHCNIWTHSYFYVKKLLANFLNCTFSEGLNYSYDMTDLKNKVMQRCNCKSFCIRLEFNCTKCDEKI